VREVVWGQDPELLAQTGYTQAGLFAVEVALFRLVESWGIRPDYVAGHSIGELSAAYVAGVFSLPDAARLVAARGGLMQGLPSDGVMVAVQATEAEVLALLGEQVSVAAVNQVSVAAVNGPESVVLSGAEPAVTELVGHFAARGRKTRRLAVSHAFHSGLMEPMLAEFAAVAQELSYATPRIPVVSNVTGDLAQGIDRPDYWVRHVRQPVRFAQGVRWLHTQGVGTFLELGPDAALSAMGPGCLEPDTGADFIPLLRRDRPEVATLLTGIGRLHACGVPVD